MALTKRHATKVNVLLECYLGYRHEASPEVKEAAKELALQVQNTLGAGVRVADIDSAWPDGSDR